MKKLAMVFMVIALFALAITLPTINFGTDVKPSGYKVAEQTLLDLTKDGPNYAVEFGGDHFIRIKVYHDPDWVVAIRDGVSSGANWVATTATNGYNSVKAWLSNR